MDWALFWVLTVFVVFAAGVLGASARHADWWIITFSILVLSLALVFGAAVESGRANAICRGWVESVYPGYEPVENEGRCVARSVETVIEIEMGGER